MVGLGNSTLNYRTIVQPLHVALATSILVEELRKLDLVITVEDDFQYFENVCNALDDKILSTQFRLSQFELSVSNVFWVRVTNKEGKIVSVQAARKELLTGITLAEHWSQQQRRIYVLSDPASRAQLGNSHALGAFIMTGVVVYHGEMWLDQSLRGTDAAMLLTRLGQITAYVRWQPDYIYGFISKKLVLRGFAARQGYFHGEPAGTHWIEAPERIDPNDWLVWNSSADLAHLAKVIAEGEKSNP